MRAILVLGVLVGMLFAGCAGNGSSSSVDDPSTSVPSTTAPGTNETKPPEEFVPKFHYHNYWNERQKVMLFDPSYTLKLGEDPYNEFTMSAEGGKNIATIGTVTFDPDTDGEDGDESQETDVVYQGTSYIEVKITWSDTNIPGLKLYYSPANTPTMLGLGEIRSGQLYQIPMRENWADMAHQLSVSRWAFRLDAYDPSQATYPAQVHRAKGDVHVEMWIINGGEKFIDPPHPYFFKSGASRYAGDINVTLKDCIVVNSTKVQDKTVPQQPQAYQCGANQRGPIDYAPDPPHIVPWETTKLVVDLYYNVTGNSKTSPASHRLGLIFHAGDSLTYRYPTSTDAGNHVRYTIPVTEKMSDSPYASKTDWAFGVYPIINDEKDKGGDFTGDIHIVLTALKEGDTSTRGMGN